MSHFSLAVFHYPDEDLEKILAPFDAGADVEKYIAFTRQEAIDYARTNFQSFKDAPDDECWNLIAADAEETDKDGNIYSTCNPNGMYDWWEKGGRWKGLLKVGDKRVDSALVKDIDFNAAPFSTFAVLTTDGEWHEQDFPEWIGANASGKVVDWDSHYKERFIDAAGPDVMLTIIDFHV